jgi:trypsin
MNLRKLSIRLSVLVATVGLTAQAAAPAPDIIGGTRSSLWPAAGMVLVDQSSSCSGFLISPTWVLTAYLCAAGVPTLQFAVGADPTAPDAVFYTVDNVVLDPDFDETSASHDVALLHLTSPVPATPFMVNDQAEPPIFSYLYILGYGVTDASGGGSLVKRLAVLTVSNGIGETQDQIPFVGGVACFGDTGAPNFDYGANGFPIAFASIAFGDELCEEYSVSIRTSAETTFIEDTVSDACFASAPHSVHCDGIFRDSVELHLNPSAG